MVKNPASRSPLNMTSRKTRHPTERPTPIPVNKVCFARLVFPAPTFWDTKEAMDCIRALGTSIAKLTILQATPYPEEASNPSRLTKAHNARKESWVRDS